MIKSVGKFVSDYSAFKKLLGEYIKTYRQIDEQFTLKDLISRGKLLANLNEIDTIDNKQKLHVRKYVQRKLTELKSILNQVVQEEKKITSCSFRKYKMAKDRESNSWLTSENLSYSQLDISKQVGKVTQQIKK